MRNETEDGGSNQNTIEVSRTWEKRDEENRDAYIMSSYHIGKAHEEKKVGQSMTPIAIYLLLLVLNQSILELPHL